ncbi:uncharacterized protein PAC_03506 [Phialocephala subalpina]|uniref:Uncharacterized protein n=1 Tax=Phialocephala subalpina TaxID=576137 RepID=A0A1L7WLH7_9HELO|nr:uncharacterized protein PAC_03506 [Phialocephala subalpina]
MPDGPVDCKSRPMKYLETWYWYRRSFFSKKPLKPGPLLPARSLDRNAPRVVLLPLTREDPSTQHLSYYGGPLAGFLQPWAPLIQPSTVSWLVLYPDELDCILDNIDVVMRSGSILKHSRASDDISIDQWSDLELEYEVSSMIGKTSEHAVLSPAHGSSF